MSQQHPINPPPGLVHKWALEAEDEHQPTVAYSLVGQIAAKAARWGADQQKIRSGPESPLVERVADAIAAKATSAGIVNDRPARAAILQVAAWMQEQPCGKGWSMRLKQEVDQLPQ